MILPEVTSLPKSASSGPESWGEAFGRVVDTSDQVMVAVENITASQENFRAAYQSYIDEVEQVTGEKLENPMNVDMRRGTFEERPNPQYSFATGAEWIDERGRVAMERFEAGRAALAQKYPAQARLISLDIDGRVKKRMQDAERASLEALQSPELGMAGRFAAQLVGGLKGSARDPYQWSMAVIGGGAGTARTVAGRLGQVMLTEALINGGQEAVLQAASQERKRAAGLEHGLDDALKNIGIAATFGSLFGGVSQGGAELARIFRLGEGGDAIAARVLDGRPEPGDVETLAKAMNVELTPERLDLINRSFEERILDEVTIPQDGNPAAMRVYEAALRHAEDPDNFPAPELVERMVAEEEAGRLLTLSPEQYERAYGGDPNAIDDIADTFFADDVSQAADIIDARDVPAPARGASAPDGRPLEIGGGALPERGVVVANIHSDGKIYIGDAGDVHFSLADRFADEKFGSPEFTGFINADGKVMDRAEAFRWVSENEAPLRAADNMGEQLDALDYREQVPASRRRPAAAANRQADPIEGQRIHPDVVAEPLDDAAMRAAEVEAGDLVEPEVDANGNPKSLLDYIAVEDGDGNHRLVPARQALEEADEGNLLADLLESCKL